jgi:hypothetical protein
MEEVVECEVGRNVLLDVVGYISPALYEVQVSEWPSDY